MHLSTMKLDTHNHIAHIVFDSSESVNAITNAFRQEFVDIVDALVEQVDTLDGVILQSAKDSFVVGADLNEISLLAGKDKAFLATEVQKLNRALRTLETLGKPVVAIINGSALGGGYEICLSTQHRIAIENEKTRIGLPEATLSLMPGAGGTIRLPRLIGVEAALPLLMEGKQLRLEQAKASGLIDEIAVSKDDAFERAMHFIQANPSCQQTWDKKGFRFPGESPKSASAMMKMAIAPSMLRSKTQGRYPAPESIMQSVFESLNVSFDSAIAIETQKFCALLSHPVSVSMVRTFWHQLNEIKKGGQRPKNVPQNTITKVGVIGAGMMGAGIAYVAANADINVVLLDTDIAKAEKGKAYSANLVNKKLAKGFVSDVHVNAFLNRIHATDISAELNGCDLIIEAVFENLALKNEINAENFEHLNDTGFFASNTSSLPISELAKSVPQPDKFIGLHFFSPVDKMPLVEIIRGTNTNDETIAKSYDFVQRIGKTPILVNDSRGFYTSRVFGTYVMEGMSLLSEGVPAVKIENAAKYLGMPVSPLAVSDEVSISLAQHIRLEEKRACQRENKPFVAHPADSVIDAMLNQFERPGKAAGKGFYSYSDDGKKQLWQGLEHFNIGNDLSIEIIQLRLLFIQALEAAKCVEEGVIESVGDANIGSIMGIGFAPWTGGALEFINHFGFNDFCEKAKEFADKYGDRFLPCKLLQEKANRGVGF